MQWINDAFFERYFINQWPIYVSFFIFSILAVSEVRPDIYHSSSILTCLRLSQWHQMQGWFELAALIPLIFASHLRSPPWVHSSLKFLLSILTWFIFSISAVIFLSACSNVSYFSLSTSKKPILKIIWFCYNIKFMFIFNVN